MLKSNTKKYSENKFPPSQEQVVKSLKIKIRAAIKLKLSKKRKLAVGSSFFSFGSGLLLLLLVLQMFWLPMAYAAPTVPNVTAAAAIAVDVDTGLITYSKNINRRVPMASTTKIMTALVALSTPGTNLTERYTVAKEDLIGEASMGLRLGETLTFSDLLYGMLLNSGNDAALAIAHYAGAKLNGPGEPISRFVIRMNSQATAFGMQNSHYANPHGLDQDGHYSSAFDLAISGWYALHNPTIKQIVNQQSATAAGHPLANSNTFLKRYAGATGIKPGITDGAGWCLVASATRNGHNAISVVLNTDQVGFNSDSAALLNYTFDLLGQPGGVTRNPPAGGGPLQTNVQYIGRPNGDILTPLAEAPAPALNSGVVNAGSAATVVVGNLSSNSGAGFAAQVNASPVPNLTPQPGEGDNTSSSGNNGGSKSGGGPNLLIILIILLIIGGVLFVMGRNGYLGGERGRNIALRVEDAAVLALRAGRSGVNKLFAMLRPGIAVEEISRPRNAGTDNNSVPKAPGFNSEAAPRSSLSERATSGSTQRPPRPRPEPTKDNNPLEGFFDEVQPFDWEDSQLANSNPPIQPEAASSMKPPQPIPPVPNRPPLVNRAQPVEKSREPELPANPPSRPPNHPNRTAAIPQQKPEPLAPIDRLRSSPPLAPRSSNSPNAVPNRQEYPEASPGQRNYFGSPNLGSAESLIARARQAIDYAYAGRLQASTDEFRKVVENDPLFDFGSLEEFEQLPVLGYKALASAYNAVGHSKFALLLLEMGIEKYPNDLELRNMLRSFKRQ